MGVSFTVILFETYMLVYSLQLHEFYKVYFDSDVHANESHIKMTEQHSAAEMLSSG